MFSFEKDNLPTKKREGAEFTYTTSSLSFFLVRREKRARHANDHARDWRRETREARGRLTAPARVHCSH